MATDATTESPTLPEVPTLESLEAVTDTVLIPLAAIEDAPWQSEHNRFNPYDPAHAHRLFADFSRVAEISGGKGMLHPITVMPVPEAAGRFWRLAGRHRQEAGRLAGWEKIEAKVLQNLNVEHAELITLFENVIRHNGAGAEREGDTKKSIDLRANVNRDRALARAAEIYRKLHPEAAAVEDAARQMKAGETSLAETVTETAKTTNGAVETFAKVAAKETGQNEKTVRKQILRGNAFTDEQVDVLVYRNVPLNDQSRIAALPEHQRTRAVELLDENATVEEAVEIARKAILDESGATTTSTPPARDPVVEIDRLPDEEWLAQSPIRDKVVRSYYDYFALLWRHSRQAREALFKVVNRETQSLRKTYGDVVSGRNSLLALYNRALGVEHPHQWKLCAGCGGAGMKDGSPHSDCGGGGFIVGQAPRLKGSGKASPKATPKAASPPPEETPSAPVPAPTPPVEPTAPQPVVSPAVAATTPKPKAAPKAAPKAKAEVPAKPAPKPKAAPKAKAEPLKSESEEWSDTELCPDCVDGMTGDKVCLRCNGSGQVPAETSGD
jgi:hypothetical protein